MIFAADLLPSDVGSEVVIPGGTRGVLEYVGDQPGTGLIELNVDGATFTVYPDALIRIALASEGRLVAEGRAEALLRACTDSATHELLAALARGGSR